MPDAPPPDPSHLTTAQIQREVSVLRELIDSRQLGTDSLNGQRFEAIEKRWLFVNEMRIEQKRDMKDALDAALAAAKEAVTQQNAAFGLATSKSETAMSEQMKQINVTLGTAIESVTQRLNEVKEQVSGMESARQGGNSALHNRRADISQMIALLSLLVSVAVMIFVVANGG